jgi:hypothetical protein
MYQHILNHMQEAVSLFNERIASCHLPLKEKVISTRSSVLEPGPDDPFIWTVESCLGMCARSFSYTHTACRKSSDGEQYMSIDGGVRLGRRRVTYWSPL